MKRLTPTRMSKSKEDYVVVLDEQYSDFKATVHEFAYLTNKDKGRGNYISMERLALNAMNKTMGKIIQKFDPIRFEVGYNEWKKQ